MNLTRPFLLALAALGLHVGVTFGQPAPEPARLPPAAPTTPTAALAVPPQATPTALPAGQSTDQYPDGLIGGAALLLVKPYFENNPAYFVNDRQGKQVHTSEHVDIRHNLQATPQVWLGYICESGVGARARYWYLRSDTSQTLEDPTRVVTAHPAGLSLIQDHASQLIVDSKLRLHVLDLEGLQAFRGDSWDVLLSAGVRLARISQSYDAFATAADGFGISLLSRHTFEGAGPVIAGEARRMIGDTGLALYGNARGSLLFGTANQSAAIPVANDVGSDRRHRGLLTGEVELGLEYGCNLGGTWLFGQVGLVGQNWFGAGSASRSTILVVPGGDFTGGGYSMDSDIAFLGVSFRLGVNY
ncbi:MAG: Lpg1974 family pore-forming outer membrane protein [Gemmataceae bacterium]